MSDIVNTINDTGNSVEVICIWDATTGQLGRAAFAHHLVYPTDIVVVTPSILDLFTFNREVGLYLPLFSTVENAVAHYAQTLNTVLMELLALPVPLKVIFADLVGVDTLAWAPVFAGLGELCRSLGQRRDRPGQRLEWRPRRSPWTSGLVHPPDPGRPHPYPRLQDHDRRIPARSPAARTMGASDHGPIKDVHSNQLNS